MIHKIRVVSLLGVFLHLCCAGLLQAEETAPSVKKAVINGASSMNGIHAGTSMLVL
jgi:hypothetical protein